jgi:hypothetical protein
MLVFLNQKIIAKAIAVKSPEAEATTMAVLLQPRTWSGKRGAGA